MRQEYFKKICAVHPGAISRILSWGIICLRGGSPRSLGAFYPQAIRERGLLLELAPYGACRADPVARAAVGSYPTLSPLPLVVRPWAVCFLLRFPSPCTLPCGRVHNARALPGVFLFPGVRTFLGTDAGSDGAAIPCPGGTAHGQHTPPQDRMASDRNTDAQDIRSSPGSDGPLRV